MVQFRCVFSPCRKYRYRLQKRWDDELPSINFIMLNPSTADEIVSDPTVTRCENRAREWGYGGLIVTNIFAFRATDPKDMKAQDDPVGPENNGHIFHAALQSADIVCGWGTHGSYLGRDKHVIQLLQRHGIRPMSLGVTKDGHPRHPLYVPYSQGLVLFTGESDGNWNENSMGRSHV